MRGKSPWIVTALLALGLVLICASHKQCINIPLTVTVLIALGVPAILLFWEHRQKLTEKLGVRRR